MTSHCHQTKAWVRLAGACIMGAVVSQGVVAQHTDGFESIFNGKDLTGWVKEGNAGYRAQGGELVCDGSGNDPTWIRTEETYENFELRLEFALDAYGEGGVFLHAPKHGRNSNVGFEIQFSDDRRNRKPATISTGAIFGAVPPTKQASKPLGQWNSVEIYFNWPTLRVKVNGETVQDLDVTTNPELKYRLRQGYIGLQDRGKEIRFRNLQARRLPDTDDIRPIFDGKSFDGWSVLKPSEAAWKIDHGEIVASDGSGYLVSDHEYQDLDLQFYVRATKFANGGVFFRWKTLVPKNRGYEVQIEDIPDSNNPTGSIYDWTRADVLPLTPGEWHLMQIFAHGRNCVVRVNGVTVAEADDLEIVRPGKIALQMHSHDATVRFKDLRLRMATK